MTYDIKADHNGQAVHRVAYGDLQAWLIVNQLTRNMHKHMHGERGTSGGGKHGKI